MLVDPDPRKIPADAPAARPDLDHLRRVDSATLLGSAGEVLIVHQQQVYRLRVTSLGKLILTK
ncbi:MAG TPA: hemin uptake protein HemP [Roseateles sp.]